VAIPLLEEGDSRFFRGLHRAWHSCLWLLAMHLLVLLQRQVLVKLFSFLLHFFNFWIREWPLLKLLIFISSIVITFLQVNGGVLLHSWCLYFTFLCIISINRISKLVWFPSLVLLKLFICIFFVLLIKWRLYNQFLWWIWVSYG